MIDAPERAHPVNGQDGRCDRVAFTKVVNRLRARRQEIVINDHEALWRARTIRRQERDVELEEREIVLVREAEVCREHARVDLKVRERADLHVSADSECGRERLKVVVRDRRAVAVDTDDESGVQVHLRDSFCYAGECANADCGQL